GDVATADAGKARRQRRALAVVLPEAHPREPAVLRVQRLDGGPGAVRRTVVHEPDLEVVPGRLHRLANARRQFRQALGLVVDRNDDGNGGAHASGRRVSPPRRLTGRDGRGHRARTSGASAGRSLGPAWSWAATRPVAPSTAGRGAS